MMNTAQFADANKAGADNILASASRAFEGVEQLTRLNIQTIKTLLAESMENTNAMLSATSPDEAMKAQSASLQGAPEKSAAYSRQVIEILTAIGASQRSAFEAAQADLQSKFLEAVNGALKNVPGSEQTRALMKSAVDAATSVVEGVTKATKDVTQAAEENVSKVTDIALSTSRKGAIAET